MGEAEDWGKDMVENHEVTSTVGAVAAGPPEAARVGARVFERGGNAMDAAAAAAMACCMLRPDMTGVGGYVFSAVVLEGKTGRAWCIDANSRAPAAAHERMYQILPVDGKANSAIYMYNINQTEYSCRVKDDANVYGPLAVGPPGMMAGMGVLWERWGKLAWPDIVEPSLKLLRDGFPYNGVAHSIRGHEEIIRRFQPTVDHLMPDGELPAEDDIWRRPDMEKTGRVRGPVLGGHWEWTWGRSWGRILCEEVSAVRRPNSC